MQLQNITEEKSVLPEHTGEIQKVIEDEGNKFMGALLRYLWTSDQLNSKYEWLSRNCKHFAKLVFDFVAKTKYWS